jgi:hypothetical protein
MIELWPRDHAALRWQADQWPGAIPTSAGASSLQRAMAKGQRGWKWQPEGGSSGEGFRPRPARTGFVAHEEIRLDRERAGDADARALAAGELMRVARRVARIEADVRERDASLARALADAL